MTDLLETRSKPIPITKDMVRAAYRKVQGQTRVSSTILEK